MQVLPKEFVVKRPCIPDSLPRDHPQKLAVAPVAVNLDPVRLRSDDGLEVGGDVVFRTSAMRGLLYGLPCALGLWVVIALAGRAMFHW